MWELAKWSASGCFLIALLLFFSPRLAATSTIPWILYLVGNCIWVADSYRAKNTPWVAIGIVFALLDALMIVARIVGFEVLDYINPVTKFVENIL